MLNLIRCEFWKLKRKMFVQLVLAASFLFPIPLTAIIYYLNTAQNKYWCCTIKVDIENSKGQYIEKDKQEATKDGSESTKIQHGI